jgi:hypothetical protein
MYEEELKRSLLEALYRHKSTLNKPVEKASLQKVFELDDIKFDSLIEDLNLKGYLNLTDDTVALSEHGFLVMNSREFSYCPHL